MSRPGPTLFCVDVEADGPCPGPYSMVSFGVVRVDAALFIDGRRPAHLFRGVRTHF